MDAAPSSSIGWQAPSAMAIRVSPISFSAWLRARSLRPCARNARQRADVLQIVDLFRAHVVDVSTDSLVIEAVGTSEKLQALLAALAPHDVREIVQSGTVAIGRGSRSITERALERVSA